jgi:hypothetical protein
MVILKSLQFIYVLEMPRQVFKYISKKLELLKFYNSMFFRDFEFLVDFGKRIFKKVFEFSKNY